MFGNKVIMDALSEYRFKTELHCHSFPASGCGDFSPEETVKMYSGLGYDAIVLTNHFHRGQLANGESDAEYIRRYTDDYFRACAEGERLGVKVIFGMEIRFTDNSNDYLVYGVDEIGAAELFSHLSGNLAEFRRDYKNDGMILIQAHPCRHGCVRAEPELLDGVEVFNLHPFHNGAIGFAAKFAHETNGVITSGSDFHHPGTAGLGGIYTKTLPSDTHELTEILRNGDYLLDIGGIPAIPDFMQR